MKNGCMVAFFVIIGGFLLFGVMAVQHSGGFSAAPRTNQVTLSAAPGNSIVQMFERVGPGDEGKVTHFPDSTRCTKVSGPTSVSIEGISMRFYRLTCNGVTGYVNAKWVID